MKIIKKKRLKITRYGESANRKKNEKKAFLLFILETRADQFIEKGLKNNKFFWYSNFNKISIFNKLFPGIFNKGKRCDVLVIYYSKIEVCVCLWSTKPTITGKWTLFFTWNENGTIKSHIHQIFIIMSGIIKIYKKNRKLLLRTYVHIYKI